MKFLNKDKLEVLKEVWGYDSFRENQEEAVTQILNGNKDVLFIAKTGLGKSLVFQVPSVMMSGVTIVLSPLLSLMSDQVSNAGIKGLDAATYNSTMGKKQKKIVLDQLENNELDLLYIAPESILNAEMLEFIKDKVTVNFVAVDEAHCVSSYGSDFRPKYGQIAILREFIAAPFVALTATADTKTIEDMKKTLKLGDRGHKLEEFYQDLDRHSIFYNVFPKIGNGYKQILNFMGQHKKEDTGIIYCLTKASVDDLSRFLYRQGIKAKPYHAGLSTKDKEANLAQWMNKEIQVIVATIAFGMGIDFPSVRYVIHANIPTSLEGFSQECVHPTSLITVRDGFKKVTDLKIGEEVLTVNENTLVQEYQPIVNIIKNKSSMKWCKITLTNNVEIKVTQDHEMITVNSEGGLERTEAKDLTKDSIILPSKLNYKYKKEFSEDILEGYRDFQLQAKLKLDFVNELRSKTSPKEFSKLLEYARDSDWSTIRRTSIPFKKVQNIQKYFNIPQDVLLNNIEYIRSCAGNIHKPITSVSEELMYVLGLVATDGNIKQVNSKQRGFTLRLRFFNTDPNILNAFKTCLDALGTKYTESIDVNRNNFTSIETDNKQLIQLAELAGICPGNKTYTVRALPSFFSNLDKNLLGAYVSGVIDGDGCTDKTCRISSASENLVRDLSTILNELGIYYNITKQKGYASGAVTEIKEYSYLYCVTIGTSYSRSQLKNYMSKYMVKNINCDAKNYIQEDQIKIKSLELYEEDSESYDLSILDNNNFFINGIASWNCGRASRDGLPSKSYLLYDPADSRLIKWMLKQSIKNPATLSLRLNKFAKMSQYATSKTCYRKQILNYFNQEQKEDNCNSCSNCVSVKKL